MYMYMYIYIYTHIKHVYSVCRLWNLLWATLRALENGFRDLFYDILGSFHDEAVFCGTA